MIHVSLMSEIIKDYVPGSELSGDRNIAVAMQADGTLMLFSIGEDEHVYMLTKAAGSSTGWQRTDLSADLPPGVRSLQLCTAQAVDGSPILAIVTEPQNGSIQTAYVTTDFALSRSPKRWSARGSRDGVSVTAMATGSGADGRPVIVVGTVDGNRHMATFLIDSASGDTGAAWREVPLPVDGSGVIDMAIGHNKKLEAIGMDQVDGLIYTLLQVDDVTRRVVVTSFPDFTIYNHLIPLAESPTALATCADAQGDTQLFLATRNLLRLDAQQQMTQDPALVSDAATAIATMGPNAGARALTAGRHPDGRLEAWWLDADGVLSFVEERQPTGWAVPIALQKQVEEMTTWRNPKSGEIDLFTLDADHKLAHLAQDTTTTRWSTAAILLPLDDKDLSKAVEIDTFMTQIMLTGADGTPLADQPVRISASSLSLISIDGSHYFVDQATQMAAVRTNSVGTLTVTTKATGLAGAKIRIEGDFMQEAIDFDPKVAVGNRLKTVSSDDLRKATVVRNGANVPLVKDSDAGRIDDTTSALHQLIKIQSRLAKPAKASDVEVDVGKAGPEAYAFRPRGSAVATPLDLSDIVNGTSWTFAGAASSKARPVAAPMGIFDDIEHSFGNIFEAVKNGLIDVAKIVIQKVDDGLKIVIHGLDQVFSAVLKFAEQVWDVVEWVFKQIGAVIQELIQWLSFLFEWQDILNTHDVLRVMTRLSLDKLGSFAGTTTADIVNGLDGLKTSMVGKKVKLPAGGGISRSTIAAANKAHGQSSFARDPKASWMFGKLNHHTLGRAKPATPFLPNETIVDILKEVGEKDIAAIQAAFQEVSKDIVDNIAKFDLEQIFDRIVAAFTDVVIDAASSVITAIGKVTQLAIAAVGKILEAHIEVPVITWIYENLIAPGSKLTILDVMCLIVAIPTTVLYKVMRGKAPFSASATQAICGERSFDSLMTTITAQNSGKKIAALESSALQGSVSPMVWATLALSIAAAVARFASAVMIGVKGYFKKQAMPNQAAFIVSAISSGLKLATWAISMVTTLSALAKVKFVAQVEIIVLAIIGILTGISFVNLFVSKFLPDEADEIFAITATIECALGLLGFAFVVSNFIVATAEEKDVDEAQRGMKFGMVASSFLVPIIAPVTLAKDPKVWGSAMAGQILAMAASAGLNFTRSVFSFVNEVRYVDI